jgi:hypothetical protein
MYGILVQYKPGFRYFVTFIDDYSRVTWLYLMRHRSELLSIFSAFYAEIKTQFNVSVRILQSDNATEYFSKPFNSCHKMEFFISLHVLTPHLKMVLQNVKIDIY